MQKFKYKVRSKDGKTIKGKIEARDTKTAVEILRQRRYFVVNITEITGTGMPLLGDFLQRVKFNQIVNFTFPLSFFKEKNDNSNEVNRNTEIPFPTDCRFVPSASFAQKSFPCKKDTNACQTR